MKIKTFILTFLMMMSSPFLFGQQHWTDPGGSLGYQNSMTVYAQVKLDNVVQTNDYQVAAFHGDQLLAVSEIIPFQGTTSNYHVHLQIYGDNSMGNIYFKFFNGTKEYVSETEFPFEVNVNIGDHPNYSTIDFYSVAQIGDVVYPTLQKAIDACKEGDNTIELLAENAEDVTIKQVEGVNVTIDGGTSRYNYSGTITIHGNARYQGEETLTFKNIDFTTNEAGHYFIDSNSTGSVERYAHNVTVLDCKFTATDAGVNSAVAMRIRQGFDIAINGGTFTNLHSALQAYGNAGITVSDITLIGKNGISAGTSTGVVIENSNITATGYGVRADGEGAYTMTLEDNTISAELPVVVRKAKAKAAYNLTIGEGNTLTAKQQDNNPEGYQVVFTNGDDGTYEAPTGIFSLTVAEGTNLNVYPVYVAELNDKKYITFDEAYTAATEGEVINLLRTVVLDDSKMWWNYSTKQITVNASNINPAFRVQSGGAMVNFGSMTINSCDGYCIIVGSSDGSIDANVSIYGGTYNGETSAISVTKGRVNILDGTFKVEPYQGSYEYTINCYDPSYKNGTADVSIQGGKFYNFNPQNNAAEGAGTDFLTARYAAVQDADGYWNVVPAVAMIEHKDSKDKYYATLPDAVAAAKDGETVTLIKDATGAGLVINKNVTVDFGGKTYTINQAVGSTGTESQGFQILKEATEVTLTNGNIAVAEGTNVVWMINDYSAKLNVTGLTFDCENMKWEKAPNVYFLVANNAHKQNPAVTLENVTVNNFKAEAGSPYYMEPETTIASSDANLDIEVDPGYRVVYNEGVYSVEKLVANFGDGKGAYARFVESKNREHFSLNVYDVYAKESLVVKVYHNETLLVTTTLREYDLDDENKKYYPYTSGAKGITVNNVVNLNEEGCKPAGSWLNEWEVEPTIENVPNRYEVYVDGVLNNELDLTANEFAGFSKEEELQTYLGFKSVYKQASITRGEDVTYYMTFDEALEASQANDVITLYDNITASEIITISKSITLNGNGKTLNSIASGTSARAINVSGADGVTIKNLTINANGERAINVIQNATNVTIENVIATAANYTVNVASSAANANVTINNSTLTGLNVVNVAAANANVTVNGGKLVCNDQNTIENYAALSLHYDATAALITATGVEFDIKGDSERASNSSEDGKIIINGVEEGAQVAIIQYASGNSYSFPTLQAAINKAKAGETVKVIRNITLTELVKIETAGIILDLNCKTVTANCQKAIEVYANTTIKNGTIEAQQRCVDTRKAVELTLDNVVLNAETYYAAHQNQQPLTIGGSDNGTKVNMTNTKINGGHQGYAIITFVKTELTATDSEVVGYAAIYTKAGSEGSTFNFVNSTVKSDITANDAAGNSFATIVTDANATINLDANSKLVAVSENQWAMAVRGEGNDITVKCDIIASNILAAQNADANTIKVKAEYAEKLHAEGYATSEADNNGLVKVEGVAVVLNQTTGKLYASLAEAIAEVANGETIKLLADCDENVTIVQTGGISFTIDGQISEDVKAKYTGTIQIDGNGGYEREETLTIKNINFHNVSNTALNYIDARTAKQSHNVTVEDCDFDGTGNGSANAIVVVEGNNWKVIGCTVNENYNSFVNYMGAYNALMNKNLLVDGCTINAKQGVLLGRFSTDCTIANSTFTNATCGINVAGRTETQEGEVLSHKLVNVTFNTEAITASYPAAAPAHTHIFNVEGYVKSETSVSYPDEIADHSDYLRFVLTTVESTLQAKDQAYLNVSVSEELAAAGYEVVYEDDTYVVREIQNVKNVRTGTTYPTLAKAIDEAQAGDVIVLLANVTEDVTVNKSLTINGKAEEGAENSEYTGTMTIPAQDLNINVQNIDFVKGGINKPEKYIGGTLTVKDCTFDGANSISYAITVRSGEELTIENSTAKNYKTGMLYVPNSVTAINIKDVEVSNVAAAFNITYSGDATFENVELGENVNYGIHFQIYGSRTYTVKNCDLKNATNPFWFWDKSNNTAKVTVVFEGNNDLGTKGITVNAGELKMATDATLTAAEGLTIEATEDGYVVEYENGVYSVIPGNVELVHGEESVGKFATIQDAIDAAENGDKIVVLEDLTVGYEDAKSTFGGNYKTFFNVSGKTVTIDLNGKTVKAVLEGEETVYAMFSVENNGVLNVEDNTNDGHAIIESESAVYSLFTCYTDGKLNINSGNFRLNRGYDDNSGSGGMIYSQEDETVIVNGGKFILDNVGTSLNGSPWIFNAKGNNEQNIEVHGGTYNYNVFNQYRIFEVQTTKEYAIKYDGDEAGTWTVVPAVAWVNNQEKSGNWYTYELGYVTLAEAFAAAEDCNRPDFAETVTLLQDITLTEGITVNADQEVVLDLNGFTVSQEKECTKHYEMIRNNGTLTIKDSTEEAQGKISFEDTGAGDPNFGWGSYTIGNYGTLVVENGTIENISTQNPGNGQPNVHMYCAIQQGHGAVSTTINGGTISNQTYRSIRTNTGALVINGGNIIGQVWVQPNQGNATLEITDGEFTPTGNDGSSVFMTNEGENYTVTSASITGGFFNTKIGATDPTKEGVAGCVTGGTFTTAAKDNTNEALINENFAFVDNGDGTWTVMPSQEQSLVKGWNWYSSYLNITTENLLGALGTNGKSIVQNSTWSATYYGVNDGTDYGWGYESHIFDVSKMYMIQTSEACELALSGNLVDASEITITLNKGWNWIGYPSNVEVKLEDALDGLQPSHGDEIKTQGAFASYYDYEGQSMWLTYSFGNGNMKPTKGYMYNNTSGETKTFTYNIVPATTRGNNETEVATHYSVDYTKYPFNMTMVAVVDGAMDDNYEVAALVNGEVRGSARPVYVEVLDAYMLFLTISGDNVEEVSFKYYDLTTGEEYDLVNRIDYSNNAMVGSVNEPYVLSRGTTGIGDAAMNQVNIYPNPTTTGTEINLQAVCDTVEVFNALGVKVAEYQNVDSIDALETAGIYVIRITNDGNVQNCRLVVK